VSPRLLLALPVLLLFAAGAVAAGVHPPTVTSHFVSEQASAPNPPDSLLAVGTSDLVDGTNAGLWFYTKAGHLEGQQSWTQFWRAAGVPSGDITGKCCVDPRALWDGYLKRFWISTMAGTCGACLDSRTGKKGTSYVFLALSDTSDANGAWTGFVLDETVNGNGVYERDWCDYDQLGLDARAIYVSCDMFPLGSGSKFTRVRVITKLQLTEVVSAKTHPTKHKPECPSPPCSWWDLEHATDPGGLQPFFVAPANMVEAGSTGEFLIDAGSGSSGHALTIRQITNVSACCDDNASTQPKVVTKSAPVASFSAAPAAPQKGSSATIATGPPKVYSVVYYKGRLYAAQTVSCFGSFSCVKFYAFAVGAWPSTTGVAETLGSVGLYDYYPALGVSRSGTLTMVYGQSSKAEFPRVDYVGIPPISVRFRCPCPSSAEQLLQSGTSSYTHSSIYHHSVTVGDYFTAATDPDLEHVWIHGNLGPTRPGTDWTSVVARTKP
jgi:hypothetical protein